MELVTEVLHEVNKPLDELNEANVNKPLSEDNESVENPQSGQDQALGNDRLPPAVISISDTNNGGEEYGPKYKVRSDY